MWIRIQLGFVFSNVLDPDPHFNYVLSSCAIIVICFEKDVFQRIKCKTKYFLYF